MVDVALRIAYDPGMAQSPFAEVDRVGRVVVARCQIAQSPLSAAPPVPRGRRGTVEDYDQSAGDYLVDFGGRYGVVLVAPTEVHG